MSLARQANLLASAKQRPQEALPLAEEALRIASRHGLAPLARQIETILNEVRGVR
jgi:hypothetical protein